MGFFPIKYSCSHPIKCQNPKPLTKFARLEASVVVRLRFPLLAAPAPEGEAAGDVGGRDPLVAVSPEPAVDIDWLEVLSVTALVLEITLPARGVDGTDVV